MEIENKLKKLKEFLILNKARQFVVELINVINESEIDFRPGESVLTKEHLIDIYSTRQEIDKDEFVIGYDEVLSNLNQAQATEFAVASIDSDNGAYIIFSDPENNNLVGILKSKRTLTEIRKKYAHHETLVGQNGIKYFY